MMLQEIDRFFLDLSEVLSDMQLQVRYGYKPLSSSPETWVFSGWKQQSAIRRFGGEEYLGFALVVDFEIFRTFAICGGIGRVQIAVSMQKKTLFYCIILEWKSLRKIRYFQRPKQNPGIL